jgi:hypothetical protein
MSIDAERLAHQVKLAYEFVETLHGQAIALIKDIETQLAQAPEELQCLRPGGYKYVVNPLSYGLERPQAIIADYYAVCFRQFGGRIKNTPLDREVPPIAFVKVVLREHGLEHPEVRFGIMTDIAKAPERRDDQWPNKVEDLVSLFPQRAMRGPAWFGQGDVEFEHQDAYASAKVRGAGVRLADLPDSEAVAERIVEPLLALYRDALERSLGLIAEGG